VAADPFDFRWGARRLAGLGVSLKPSQVAVTEVPGYTLVVAPILDPICEEAYKVYGPDNKPLYAPMILKTTLNEDRSNHYSDKTITLQDEIDDWEGEEWRQYARSVGDLAGGMQPPCCTSRHDDITAPVWNSVMLDSADAKRMMQQVERTWNASGFPLLEHYRHLAEQIEYCSGGTEELAQEDPEVHEEWVGLCEEMGLDATLQPWEQPLDWDAFAKPLVWELDADLQKTWDTLLKSSKENWEAMQSCQGKEASSFARETDLENPWV
jgi:hypothetical protein